MDKDDGDDDTGTDEGNSGGGDDINNTLKTN
jgi:hypothetical protein